MGTTIAWDETAWAVLAAELDAWRARASRATFWWRDDDAGRPVEALPRLLGLAGEVGLPLGLAVVPAWLAPEVAAAIRSAPAGVVVLQHGFAHVNHEPARRPGQAKERPAECGAARPPQEALEELAAGKASLSGAFGERVLSVFVPPWNRIAPAVLAGLPGTGYRVVSTFGPRPACEPAPGLLQLNCHADVIAWREGRRFAGAAPTLERLRAHLAARRAGQADPAEATGLLTHHRDMDAACWTFTEELLGRLRRHPGAAFPPLAALFQARHREAARG